MRFVFLLSATQFNIARFLVAPALAVLAGVGASPSSADDIYQFETLRVNNFIHGQDNWIDQPGQGQAVVSQNTDPANGTKVVRHFQTVAFHESAFITRVNDANFGFHPFNGTETGAIIQFDSNGEHIAMFALGHDLNGDGMVKDSDGEVGPAFGTYDRNFRVQGASNGSVSQAGLGAGNAGHEWYRMQLRIDFTANDGDGSGSLSYKNLSDGDPEFRAVPALQDINLELGQMDPNAGPATWDAMWLHLRSGGSNVPNADNLIPNVRVALPGDVNCDGSLNGADIDPFFLALGDPALYASTFPNCDIMNGDVNGDGAVNGADIDVFFECLGAGACP